MADRKQGHIINISSVLARQVYPLTMFYAATKHATAALTRGMRIELAVHGVRVTEIAPGLLDTGLMAQADHPTVVKAYAKREDDRLQKRWSRARSCMPPGPSPAPRQNLSLPSTRTDKSDTQFLKTGE